MTTEARYAPDSVPDSPMRPIASAFIDTWLSYGVAAESIVRMLLERPRLELRLSNGRFTLWQDGEPTDVRVGTAYIEPTADDWRKIAALIHTIPEPVKMT